MFHWGDSLGNVAAITKLPIQFWGLVSYQAPAWMGAWRQNFLIEKTLFMAGFNYLTKEGYERLRAELDELKTTGRKEVAEAIAEAREKGDLSENAEYDAAKDAQGLLEMKINELEKTLANARLVDASQLDSSKVTVLAKVKIKNKKSGKQMTYQLVSELEADLKAKKISVSSPMGKGLLGKAVGDTAVVETPRGNIEFEIVDISL